MYRGSGRPITKSGGSGSVSSLKSVTNYGQQFCGFCKRNGESAEIYMSHLIKDDQGKVLCPQLRSHVCELCGATGGEAHTRSHCPIAKIGRNDPSFQQLFYLSGGTGHFHNMVNLKRTRVNSAGKVRKHF